MDDDGTTKRVAVDAKKLGVEIAKEMIASLGDSIQGIQVSAPFGRIDLALDVLGM